MPKVAALRPLEEPEILDPEKHPPFRPQEPAPPLPEAQEPETQEEPEPEAPSLIIQLLLISKRGKKVSLPKQDLLSLMEEAARHELIMLDLMPFGVHDAQYENDTLSIMIDGTPLSLAQLGPLTFRIATYMANKLDNLKVPLSDISPSYSVNVTEFNLKEHRLQRQCK